MPAKLIDAADRLTIASGPNLGSERTVFMWFRMYTAKTPERLIFFFQTTDDLLMYEPGFGLRGGYYPEAAGAAIDWEANTLHSVAVHSSIAINETGVWFDGVRISVALHNQAQSATDWVIGNRLVAQGNALFNGELYDLRAWSRFVSHDEITAMHNAGPHILPDPLNLELHLEMLENFSDTSGNNYSVTNSGVTINSPSGYEPATRIPKKRRGGRKRLNYIAGPPEDEYWWDRIDISRVWQFVLTNNEGNANPEGRYMAYVPGEVPPHSDGTPMPSDSTYWARSISLYWCEPVYRWGVRKFFWHNPFGLSAGAVYDFDQYVQAQDANLDWLTEGFVEAFSAWLRARRDAHIQFYLGGIFASFTGLSDPDWFDLANRSIAPIRELFSAVGHQISLGIDTAGIFDEDTNLWTLRNTLLSEGMTVYCEPLPDAAQGPQWAAGAAVVTDAAWENRGALNAVPDADIAGPILRLVSAQLSLADLKQTFKKQGKSGKSHEVASFLEQTVIDGDFTIGELLAYP